MITWILIGLLLLFLLVFFTILRISVYYGRVGDNDQLRVEITAWFRLIRLHFELPMIRLTGTEQGPTVKAKLETEGPVQSKEKKAGLSFPELQKKLKRIRYVMRQVRDLQQIVKQMIRHVRCERLEWHTALGLGEAAETGALSGLIWGIKSMIVTMASHAITLRTIPRISVQPVWNDRYIRTDFRLIFRFMLGHALIAGVRILIRFVKGRLSAWQTRLGRSWGPSH